HRLKYPVVKVKLLETKEELKVSPDGSFVIKCYSQKDKQKDSEYFSSARIRLKSNQNGICLGTNGSEDLEKNLQKAVIEPRGKNQWFYLNGKKYRGILEVSYSSLDTSALALNLVYIEDYLKGVLPEEIGNWSEKELEALKAQAIAARTYALNSLGNYNEEGYNLESTVADQVYTGADYENQLANLAIKKTQGMVLSYNGRLIKAHYHANCGGWTENIEDVWNEPPEPYLSSLGDNGYCSWAKNATWQESWSREELETIISTYLKSYQEVPPGGTGKLLDLQILKRSASGRVSLLELRTDKGVFRLEKDNIRWVLRRENLPHSILPSTFFDIELRRDSTGELGKIIFSGSGNGHGVGMCQTGALGRARAGHTYRAILTYYYRGAKIVKIY
ncbi:MAG TPA: SpoIID/LytB domain-containing protein, partial [Terriglobales bacterium]|nr:SpoIID/LytB domain-containing protein [Terriglobales bacterium]